MTFGRSDGAWSRARRVVAIGAASVMVGGAAAAYSTASSSAATPPSTQQQEKGMQRGLPLAQPADLNTTTPPVLDLRLVAKRTLFDIGGKKVWGKAYNGQFVGPTIHLVRNERVHITLVNELSTSTNLHFHGLHLSPTIAADNPFISVPSGHSFTYGFTVPPNQALGTFWYHDHDMCMGTSSTMSMSMPGMQMPSGARMQSAAMPKCLDIESQLYDGLSGTIIVGDNRSELPPALRNVRTRTLVLKDMQITAANQIVENTASSSIDSNAPTVRLVNGQLLPQLTMRPGSTEMWRLVNEGADVFYNLSLPHYTFTVIAEDGQPSSKATSVSTLLLAPGKRFDVLVTAPKTPDSVYLHSLAYSGGPQGDSYPDTELMKVTVGGSADDMPSLPVNTPIDHQSSLASAPIAQHRDLHLGEDASGLHMTINGKPFDMNKSIFSTPAVRGTVEEWTVYNDTGENHPFHLHTDQFQVMSINGQKQTFNGYQDTVVVPFIGQAVIRVQFTDFIGRIMFHCHIAAHEVAGMMSFINVVAPPG